MKSLLKKLFGIIILGSIIFIGSSKNASALKIQNLERRYVSSINFRTYTPNAAYNNQAINNYVYSPVYSATVGAGQNFRASSLVITLESSISVQKNQNWDLTVYLYTFMDSFRGVDGETLIPAVLCPSFSSSGVMIDDCNVEYHDMINSPIDITSLQTTTPADGLPAAMQNKIHGYYAIKLKGHYTQGSSGASMNLSGPFLSAYNPTLYSLDLQYIIGFGTFRVYNEVPDDDAAAEELEEMNNKDDQDRSDIESQSSTTDGQADTAGSAAETTGTSLFSAFGQLLTALTNVNGTSCKLPNMQIYSLNLGQMDLCTYTIPSQIMALVSIGMVFIIVPLGIHLVKKMINLYKEITG